MVIPPPIFFYKIFPAYYIFILPRNPKSLLLFQSLLMIFWMLYLYLGIGGILMRRNKLTTTLLALDSLSIYRGLLKDKVLSRLKALLICLDKGDTSLRKVVNLYNDFYFPVSYTHLTL